MNLHLQHQLLRGWRQRFIQPGVIGAIRWNGILCGWQRKSFSTLRPFTHQQPVSTLLRRNMRDNIIPQNNAFAYNSVRWTSSKDDTWLWEVSDVIKGYNEGNKHGTRSAIAVYTLNSVKPIEPEHVQRAFESYIRILPNMRTVVRQRGDSVWFCQPHNHKLDFEVWSNEENFLQDCFDMVGQGFSGNESLPWRARMIARGPDAPCYVEGVKERYPYQYDLSMTCNHALTDGVDHLYLINCLLHCLNCVLEGKDINEVKVGVFENNTDLESLLSQRREKLLQDKNKFHNIKSTLPMVGEVPTIFEAFPPPKVSKPVTKHILRIIDVPLMKGLFSKCAEKGVTFNSLSLAACNVALTGSMVEAGLIREIYKVTSNVFMNSRRYRNSKEHLHGCYVIPLTYTSEVQSNTIESFWEYCRKINQELHLYYTEEGRALDQAIVQSLVDAEHPPFNFTDNPRPVTHDYSHNFLGDLTKMLQVAGDHVQLTNISMFQKIQNFRNGFVQGVFTFRGRTQYTFCYSSNYFSDETANLIADKVIHTFNAVGK